LKRAQRRYESGRLCLELGITSRSGRYQMLDLQEGTEGVVLLVKVQPRASKDDIAGVVEGALKVLLQAPAVEDRANEALCQYLARLLKTPKSAVRILSGSRSRVKRVEIRGVTGQEIRELLTQEA
jgi:uncharacterized protein (TIGR00251 family)